MLKAVEQLVKGYRNCIGNHRVEHSEDTYGSKHTIDRYYYHSTAICTADITTQRFTIDDGGWGTQSTSRAINDYRKWFISHYYDEVFDKFYKLVDMLIDHCGDNKMYRCYYGDVQTASTQVTVSYSAFGKEKFAEIEVSKDTEDKTHSYTIFYKNRKHLEAEIKKTIGQFFPQ